MLRLALYQPDIPQNAGAAIRLASCLNVGLDMIEPFGFRWDMKKLRQAALDYYDDSIIQRHSSWQSFYKAAREQNRRCVLMTTGYDTGYTDFSFHHEDILIAGRESAGVPGDVHEICDARIGIPMAKDRRSLNVINASAMILSEALRQVGHFESHMNEFGK